MNRNGINGQTNGVEKSIKNSMTGFMLSLMGEGTPMAKGRCTPLCTCFGEVGLAAVGWLIWIFHQIRPRAEGLRGSSLITTI
jgi:hypothetical protein